MKIHDFEQRSAAWFWARLGIPTASEFHKIVTPTGKLSAQSSKYMHRLLAEWVTGQPLTDREFQSEYMIRGVDLEQQAREVYEFSTGETCRQVGFITRDDGMVGCSPDALVGDKGGLEMKCPSPPVHIGYMLMNEIDEAYKPQVQGCLMLCEDRDWLDVQSYCPGFPTVRIRAYRDEKFLAVMRPAIDEFVDRLLAARMDLTQRFGIEPKPSYVPPAPLMDKDDPLGVSDADLDQILKQAGPRWE